MAQTLGCSRVKEVDGYPRASEQPSSLAARVRPVQALGLDTSKPDRCVVVTGRALAGRLLRGVGRIMRPWATMDTKLAGAVTGAIGASRNGRRVLPRSGDKDEDDWGGNEEDEGGEDW
ncbi:hypothetical protein ACRE_084560 [Hapsidospora chrysogenum ATCC 11550]|uniref:Uncharacterized protein n=1 Tax=Hapsidospora chrysogenum (strain ATCC 11550 / CBS 779.69 / DSM 880 / IAM 14645 / JCM 23072 / IMI 49137) TaxID=857340 RepID=A0A086SUR1_HAPC1|nr:hypothetical protein ACRE_084560 [Hapsidospora chrysogenum ATCC 11550]